MSQRPPSVSAIVVAYGAETWLEPLVHALLSAPGVRCDVVLVDNGCTDGATERLSDTPAVTVIRPSQNLGFAGGCNAGVEAATGEVIVLVNPDARIEPGALAALAAVALRDGIGIATASVVLADRPHLLNSAGNEIHFTGMSWSGHFEELAADHGRERDVLAASGAAMAIRRSVWQELGGFEADFFAYYEDADLSLRCWLRGLRVVYVPEALVHHRYEFSRNPEKFFLLERNRSFMVWSCYSRRMLVLLGPVMLLLEGATFVLSVAQGWSRHKRNSWGWLWRNRHRLHDRRRAVQATRTASDRALAPLFAIHLAPGNLALPEWTRPLDPLPTAYWSVVRRLL